MGAISGRLSGDMKAERAWITLQGAPRPIQRNCNRVEMTIGHFGAERVLEIASTSAFAGCLEDTSEDSWSTTNGIGTVRTSWPHSKVYNMAAKKETRRESRRRLEDLKWLQELRRGVLGVKGKNHLIHWKNRSRITQAEHSWNICSNDRSWQTW